MKMPDPTLYASSYFGVFLLCIRIKTCSVRLYLHIFTHSGVQHILCCVLFFFFLCTLHLYAASFSGMSNFDCPSVISNAYLPQGVVLTGS